MMASTVRVLLGATLGVATIVGAATAQELDTTSATNNDVRFSSVLLETGVKLNYAESGPADGEVLILLHGVTDSWFSFSKVLPLLATDVRAYALDQRGHGDSDRPEDGYTPHDLARDVVAFMNAKSITRATIVGHSMGSYVAQQVAVLAPDRVARLVLIGSSTTPRNIVDFKDLNRDMQALTDPVPVEFIRAFQESTVHAAQPVDFMARVIAESQKLPARVWRASFTGMAATAAPTELSQRRIPTLIIWGDRDPLMSRAEQDGLIAQHGTALLLVYRAVGHAPHWERPDDVARDIAAFLRSEPARLAGLTGRIG